MSVDIVVSRLQCVCIPLNDNIGLVMDVKIFITSDKKPHHGIEITVRDAIGKNKTTENLLAISGIVKVDVSPK
jgi:hypothetical protein